MEAITSQLSKLENGLFVLSTSKSKWVVGQDLRFTSKKARIAAGRSPEPSYALIDSRSAKTTAAADERGYDGGKKVKGRKHHIVTDAMGLLLFVKAHAANIHDTIAGGAVIQGALRKYPSLLGVCGDAGYRKTFEEEAAKLGLTVDIVQRIADAGWMILPKRYIT
jgi:hypothetical protein